MARTSKQKELDDEIERLMETWVVVSQARHPAEYEAWQKFRVLHLGKKISPKAFTVPSMMPPISPSEILAYLRVVALLRRAADMEGFARAVPESTEHHAERRDDRPIMWFLRPYAMWQPWYREDEVPLEWREVYDRHKAAARLGHISEIGALRKKHDADPAPMTAAEFFAKFPVPDDKPR